MKKTKSNIPKTFYKNGMLQQFTLEGCFGDFWKDVFSMKITTKKEREELMKKNENLNTHSFTNGLGEPFEDDKSEPKRPKESGFNNYIKKVMLFNSTPKVNLVG